jgi:hypothetical protein
MGGVVIGRGSGPDGGLRTGVIEGGNGGISNVWLQMLVGAPFPLELTWLLIQQWSFVTPQ